MSRGAPRARRQTPTRSSSSAKSSSAESTLYAGPAAAGHQITLAEAVAHATTRRASLDKLDAELLLRRARRRGAPDAAP